MIIQLSPTIKEAQRRSIDGLLSEMDIPFYDVKTQIGNYMVCTPTQDFDIRRVGRLPGISDVHRVNSAHKMVSSNWKVGPTTVHIGDQAVGNGELTLMAGPCSIESEEQVLDTVKQLKKNGISIMRGGVYKPRTSPYSFRGLGFEGLKMFYEICSAHGIKIISEVMEAGQIEAMLPYVDVFQLGARNSQNFNLLDELGRIDKPVLIKRGISGSIDELLHSAEYVFKGGNEKLLLCERGVRTFERAYRNTLDLNAVPILKEKSHLPVIVDPSHGIGIRKHVATMALASIAAGADGLLLEIHKTPEKAISDGQQTLDFGEFDSLVNKANTLFELINS